MEFSVAKANLLPELALLQGVVERRNTIPILSHLLFDVRDGFLFLAATDLDLTLRTNIEAEVVTEGSATVSAKKVFELVRNLPDGPIRFRLLENNHVEITCGRSHFKLIALSSADYPTLPTFDFERSVSIPHKTFARAVAKILFAVSQEEGRFQIAGGLIKLTEKAVQMISTDGHRLAFVEFPADDVKVKGAFPEPTLVPRKALFEIQRFEAAEDERLVFGPGENHLFFRVGKRELVSRSLDVRFPDYEKVISKDNDRRVSVSVPEFQASLKRVALFASDHSRGVRLECAPGELILSSASAEVGEARETLPVKYDGENIFIGLNAHYLEDFLAEVETAEVELALRDENTHCLGKPAGPIEGISRYLYVVMPMRL